MPNNIVSSDSEYQYQTSEPAHTSAYIWQPILQLCSRLRAKSVLDLGCGNGSLCRFLHEAGYMVDGCDPSESGIIRARQTLSDANFHVIGVYDDPIRLNRSDYDVVISSEVVEHLFAPRYLPRFAASVLKPGGHLILTTPYHGYLKNLVLSLTNKWDSHHTPLWDGGHIKFWSRKTLTELLETEHFRVTDFIGTGRIPYMWKSMVIIAQKVSSE